MEDLSPHFPAPTPIFGKAPTNELPKRLWTYKKLPRVFSAAAISNGIVLASFQNKGFPRPSANHIVLCADRPDIEPQPPYFAVFPEHGQMSFSLWDLTPNSPNDIVADATAVRRGWQCASQLGIDLRELAHTNAASPGNYAVFLPRQIDGIQFLDGTQGFQIQLRNDGKLTGFGLLWPTLQREQNCVTASPQEIISCIRAYKTPAISVDGRVNYLAEVKNLARAKRLTITHGKPFYTEGPFGELPRDNEPAKVVEPIAELEAIADFGTNTAAVRLYAPILASDVKRLLGQKHK